MCCTGAMGRDGGFQAQGTIWLKGKDGSRDLAQCSRDLAQGISGKSGSREKIAQGKMWLKGKDGSRENVAQGKRWLKRKCGSREKMAQGKDGSREKMAQGKDGS